MSYCANSSSHQASCPSINVFEPHQPCQAAVVCSDQEMAAKSVVSELVGEGHYCQQLFSGGVVRLLGCDEALTGEGYWPQTPILHL